MEFFDSAPSLLLDTKPESAPRGLSQAKVIDLSALWAGPLCAHLLHRCGAHVTTVSIQRPDGAQFGSPDFYRHLHAGHDKSS